MQLKRIAAAIGLLARAAGQSLVHRPRPMSLAERLAMIPLRGAPVKNPVVIHWNENQIPFIEAESDTDLAVGLGVVHAHLRMTQIEIMRRLSQGRVSEIVGGLAFEIDRIVRTFEIGRAAPEILAMMPAESRAWLDAFVRGINHTIASVERLPPESLLLGLGREPWTPEDVVILGRLASADVSWLVWSRMLPLRGRAGWPTLWQQLMRADRLSAFSETNAGESLLGGALRSGSNSLVVAASRSASGGALIANDPHLGFTLPNPFLIGAIKSPSHHALGMMIPGIPFIAMGRNPVIAWGGASLHAASSDLVAVPAGAKVTERTETVHIRGEADRTITIRSSVWGPLISDLRPFRRGLGDGDHALRWIGHRPSDEFTAMLAIGRARDFSDVRRALEGFALPGLEMNFAHRSGQIAQFVAAHLPRRHDAHPPDITGPPGEGWDDPVSASALPAHIDPECGYLVSANTRPEANDPIIGFLFSPPGRRHRLIELISASARVDRDTLRRMQTDVQCVESVIERDHIFGWIAGAGIAIAPPERLMRALKEWTGDYDAASEGALAFELVFTHLVRALVPKQRRRAYLATWATRGLLWADVLAADPNVRARALRRALREAARDFGSGADWGSRHRLRLQHVLGVVPLIGRSWRIADIPVSGTSETVMKSAHPATAKRHAARYGTVARHISDMSGADENDFVLLGGEDGWFGSSTATDQVALWRSGEYVRLPLAPETARALFPHRMRLTPG
jgi:penicillin G amidase